MSQSFDTDEFLNSTAFGDPFTVDGSKEYNGSLRKDYILVNGVESLALILMAGAADMVEASAVYDSEIVMDGVTYLAKQQMPDNAGFVDIVLELQ